MSLYKRILKRLKMTYKNFKNDCNFSLYYALLRICDDIGGRIKFVSISKKAHVRKEEWIQNYLHSKLSPVLKEYSFDNLPGTKNEVAPIWVCWWTGKDNAPELVKQCLKSTYINSGEHPVYFIDKDNYSDYISIPEYILEKVESNNICLAHLCDYIRVSLITKYGGLWLDSTIFSSNRIPEEYFNYPFFTCKSEYAEDSSFISKLRWVTFVLGGWQNNVLFRFLQSAFEMYWKNEKVAIDYLFFDHLIELGYRNIDSVKNLIDNVPINNIHRDVLQAAMNEALPSESFEKILDEYNDTVLYKLSWRENYSLIANNGKDSIYSHFINTVKNE